MSPRNSGLWSWMEAMKPRMVARNNQRMALPKKKSTGPRAEASTAARSAAGYCTVRAARLEPERAAWFEAQPGQERRVREQQARPRDWPEPAPPEESREPEPVPRRARHRERREP